MGLLLSFLLSFGFAAFYAVVLYWLDRYEKEPRLLLGAVFLWGAVVAVVNAFLAEAVLQGGVQAVTGSSLLAEVTGTSLIAPIVEEFVKGMGVLLVYLIFRSEFDSVLDGIIYAGVVALGFAATENTGYLYAQGYLNGGYGGLGTLFFLRILLGGWDHPFYTAFTGIGLATARLSHSWALKLLAPLAGLLVAMLAHAFKNTLLTTLGGVGLLIALPVNWIGWLSMFGLIVWAILRERGTMREQLRDEVAAGRLTPAQYGTAVSLWRPTAARFNALVSGRYRATSRFYQVCGELAHKKSQRRAFGEERGNTPVIEHLQAELSHLAPRAAAG